MNLSQFFDHWSIAENPFRGEEARHDAVFARMGIGDEHPDSAPTSVHSDFEKILGELDHPSTAIVFGEKGSGKTAIRLQLADRVRAHNDAHQDRKVFLLPYDDLNGVLDRIHRRVGSKDARLVFEKFRLVDHIDAIIALAVVRLEATLLGAGPRKPDAAAVKTAKRLAKPLKRDLLTLHAVYADGQDAHERTRRLRRLLHLRPRGASILSNTLALFGWVPGAAGAAWLYNQSILKPEMFNSLRWVAAGLLGVWLLAIIKRIAWDRLATVRLGRKVRRQIRILDRTDRSFGLGLRQTKRSEWTAGQVPMTESDEPRYAMLDRLRRVLAGFGYTGLMVLIDRVDEPTLINGDPDRMRAVIWPMLNNKFLAQEGLGVKMLLPIELRHALFKESSAFFQEARLDKQNLIERLSWTGAMLYDLCDARLRACQKNPAPAAQEDGEPRRLSLLDLFAEDVTRQDIVDALDQMHQPRDAFKFLYRCLNEHCSNVTAEQAEWRIPRLVVETVKKQESDRVQQLYRGIRPA